MSESKGKLDKHQVGTSQQMKDRGPKVNSADEPNGSSEKVQQISTELVDPDEADARPTGRRAREPAWCRRAFVKH